MSCSICSRPDANELGAALRAAASREPGAESLNAISKRLGLRKEALIRHRDECLESPGEPVRTTTGPPPDQAGLEAEPPTGPQPSIYSIKNPKDDPPTSPRKLIAADVEERCMALRVKGRSYADIAREVGVDSDTAIDAVERVLVRTRRGADDKADLVRKLELERIDRLIEGLWDRATDPGMASVDVPANTESGVRAYDGQDKAVDRVLRAMERKAKLEGLDVPTGPSTVVNILQAPGIMDFVREVRGKWAELHPETLPALDDHLRGLMLQRRGLPPGRTV